MLNESEKAELEQLIDSYGVADVLGAIESICHEKAEHVATNWQDHAMASAWRAVAERIAKVAAILEREL